MAAIEKGEKKGRHAIVLRATALHHMSYWDARDSTRDKNGQITTIDSDPARLFLMQSVMAQNIRCIVPPQPDFQMLSKFHQERRIYIYIIFC